MLIVSNKIWEEIKQAKANVISIRIYTDDRRFYERLYQFFIALCASVGAFGSIKFPVSPLISTIVIGVVSLIKAIFPQFIQPEQELCELDSIMNYYNKFLSELEHLAYQLKSGQITEQEAELRLYELKLEEVEKQSVMNKLQRWISNRQKKKNNIEAEEYLNEVYFDRYEREQSTNDSELESKGSSDVNTCGTSTRSDNPTKVNASSTKTKKQVKKNNHGR